MMISIQPKYPVSSVVRVIKKSWRDSLGRGVWGKEAKVCRLEFLGMLI
jgi:hypothetical protein